MRQPISDAGGCRDRGGRLHRAGGSRRGHHFRRRRLPGRERRREGIAARQGRRDAERRSRASRGIRLETPHDDALDASVQVADDRRRRRDAPCSRLAISSAMVAASRARCPVKSLVEHEAERVDVAARRDLAARELFRRHVGRRAGAQRSRRSAPARPKSVIRIRPLPSSMMFAGFRSRWTTPRSWAAARPAQICRASSIARPAGKRPMRRSSDARSSPSTYSIDRNVCPSISPTS